jgi:hypothetical protein
MYLFVIPGTPAIALKCNEVPSLKISTPTGDPEIMSGAVGTIRILFCGVSL